jgi:hypothetical protein
MREVSLLLFFFAALNGLVSLLLLTSRVYDVEVLVSAAGGIVTAIIYVGLAIMLRRGSIIALWITGVLFVLDSLLMLAEPSGKGLGAMIVSRIILTFVLVRYVLRERRAETE